MTETKLFPVTVVGSWTRPEWLVRALRSRQADEISAQEFNRIADDAVLSAIKYQEDAGVDIVADGEMRRDNFYSFVVEKLGGMRLMKLSQLLDYIKDRAGIPAVRPRYRFPDPICSPVRAGSRAFPTAPTRHAKIWQWMSCGSCGAK